MPNFIGYLLEQEPSSTQSFAAVQIMESALRRAGVKTSSFSSEIVYIVRDQFNLMLLEMANLGIQLWARDQVILPLYQNFNEVPTPADTSVVITTNQRTLTRAQNASVFSDSGTAAFAFDDDFDTDCTMTGTGSIGALFSSTFQITTVGVLSAVGGVTYGLVFEYTIDGGTTWVSLTTVGMAFEDTPTPQWIWTDVQGCPPSANGFRVRNVGPDNMNIAELYFGNNPTEIPMGVWSLDDWNAMTVKDTPGPPFNWYQQRDLVSPTLFVWPMPNDQAKYLQLVCWRRRYLRSVDDMTASLDISRRWTEAMTASLARRLCRELPEADMNRYSMLSQEESNAMTLAAGEERDPAPMRYSPGLDVYTRL